MLQFIVGVKPVKKEGKNVIKEKDSLHRVVDDVNEISTIIRKKGEDQA